MLLARDIFYGKLVRLLAALDLEMHTPIHGSTWVCKRRKRIPRFVGRRPPSRHVLGDGE